MKLVVVDYGMGNLRSVAKAFEFVARQEDLAVEVTVSGEPRVVDSADRVVFPGQGAMPDCMRHLRESGLEASVRNAAVKKPFFGICVGMQMLLDHSEEGDTDGLGVIAGRVKRFRPADAALKVPHMGWNMVSAQQTHPLTLGLGGERFYFVHSYYCELDDSARVIAVADYGHPFAAAIAQDNIVATQFHPEKSHRAGLVLYQNFLQWNP